MPHTSETQLPASRFSPAVKRTLRHAGAVVFGFTTLFVVYFAPAIFTNRLLAPGDGVSQYLPNFYSERVLWDTLILGGFPMLADSQFMSWYPLAFCFAFGFGGYNAFLIAAYVLAGSFTYGYVYTLTESRLAGAASGIVYSTSGFMMAHLGHTTIVHSAAWLPLLIWSLEMLRRGGNGGGRARVGWFAAGALAVACGAFAGHPQMFTYMMCLAGAYALVFGWTTPLQHGGRWRYFLRAALLVLIGVGMAAVQLWPTAELAGESLRQKMSFPQFVSYAIPPDHLPLLLLPLVFGGSPASFYGISYFGAWGPVVGGSGATELTGYVGLLSLMLAVVGVFVWPERRLTIFWTSAAAVALLLVLGDATPLAALTFRLPVINLYRVPARHLLEVGLAASVLAGLGVAAVQRGAVSSRQVWGGVAALAALLAGALLLLAWHDDAYRALAIKTGVGHVSFAPWRNPAVGLPLLLFAAGAGVLVYWQRRPRSPVRWVLLLIVLTLDLASLGWVSEWRYYLQRADVLARPDYANRYSQKLNATRQRMLPIRGGLGETTDIPPNRSRIWDVPSASAYGPFLLSRVAGLLSMAPHGAVDESWREGTNQGVNLMAIRYVFTPRAPTALTPTDARTERWAADDMSLMLGSGCGQPRPTEVTIELPAAVNATAISIASALACAIEMPDETEVARVELTDEGGQVHTRSLLAGRDTSEWAGGCADVRPLMKHRLAPVFRTYEIEREGKMCEGRQFQTTFTLDGERRIKSLRLLRQGTIGSLIVLKISLLDEPAGRAYPLSPSFVTLADPLRWRHVEDIGESSVFENLRALPRAWLVPEVVALRPDEVLAAIRSSRLPDGRSYEPRQIALVEQPELTFKAAPFDAQGMAEVRDVWSKGIEVATRSQSPAFLVLSDVYYPGWRAEVDGKAADVWRTNYALRGVAVPAGEHVVRFTYRPRSFYRGALVSGASLLALAAFTVWGWRRQRRGHDDDNDEQAPPTTTTTDT
ncbi:MAG: YfhO family protein, partial [Pyrinomonadaceae bacterium]|nr:YfhO family protein [Pyrinomonadaceae bacterium]